MELNRENINKIFNNSENAYYGHGTNGDSSIINSIFNKGLRCSHGSMYFTTCNLGQGENIDKDIVDMLNNWPHLSAKKIVIVSLPIKYTILDSASLGTYNMATEAYCYEIDGENFVLPEFLMGYYDVKTKEFNANSKYYEFLSKEEQENLFERVKEKYIKTIDNACGLEYYKEVLNELPGWEFPLTEEETYGLTSDASKKI